MKYLILTTDSFCPKWKTIDKKKSEILKALRSGKGGEAWESVSLVYADIKPIVENKKIQKKWLDSICLPYLSQGYNMVALHSSESQWKEWGIVGIRGSNPNDNLEMESMYFSADENSLREGLNRFVQVCLHETSHGYFDKRGIKDVTHEYHDKHKDIRGLFVTFDWTEYLPIHRGIRHVIKLLRDKFITPRTPKPTNDLLPLVKRRANLVLEEMNMLGMPMRIVEGFRSIERQNQLYAQGRTAPGNIVTNAKGGESLHNYGVAVDFVFRQEGYNATEAQWKTFGFIGKKHGFVWGGDWKKFVDRPHLELTLDYSLKDFQMNKVDYTKYQ